MEKYMGVFLKKIKCKWKKVKHQTRYQCCLLVHCAHEN